MQMISKVEAIKALCYYDAGLQTHWHPASENLVCMMTVGLDEAEETAIANHLIQLKDPTLIDNRFNEGSSCPMCGNLSSVFCDDGSWFCDDCSCSW